MTAILVLAVLYFAREVFIPLALAGLLAFLLAPAATRIERWRVKRAPAALLVILLSLAGGAFVGWMVLGQVYSLAVELPQYQQNVAQKIDAFHTNSVGRLSSTVEMLSGLGKQLTGAPEAIPVLPVKPRRKAASHGVSIVPGVGDKGAQPVAVRVEAPEQSMLVVVGRTMMPLVHPLTTTFIVVIFLVFMLLGREDLRDRGLRLAGSTRMHVTTTAIEDASRRVSRYLQMQLVVNLCYGAVAALLLWRIGVPNPLLWGVLACVLRFVPYIGIMMAAAGPLLLSVAAFPGWHVLMWTVVMYLVLEVVTANFVEPMLYGASTGISAIAILIAAIFWTLLWGLPGLLLSTPLTVCLVVIGRQVPRLRYLDVLFGEEAVLPLPERFYQRLLASSTIEAKAMIQEGLKTRSREDVYDTLLVPAVTMIEEARHSEEMTGTRAEEVLQQVEELAEELAGSAKAAATAKKRLNKMVICVPGRDFADEVACQLAVQILGEMASTRVIAMDSSTQEMFQILENKRPEVICVVGVPPSAIRHLRLRCHQIRTRFPDAVVVACVLSKDTDLPNLRSRIPTEDAQHVVNSLLLMKEYVTSLLDVPAPPVEMTPDEAAKKELVETVREMEQPDVLERVDEGIFNRLATNLARSFDAPIALIKAADGERHFWEAACGLPEEALSVTGSTCNGSICSRSIFYEKSLVIPDTADEEQFANDPFLREKGIRFYAGVPLKMHDGETIGFLCVLDTRPREISEQQKEVLTSVANSVMMAIELRGTSPSGEEPEDDRM